MEEKRNIITVTIQGKDYKIISMESEEYLEKIANEINRRITQIKTSSLVVGTEKAAVLASLNIFDDSLKTVEANEILQKQVMKCVKEIKQLKQNNSNSQHDIEDLNKDENYKEELERANNRIAELEKAILKLSGENTVEGIKGTLKMERIKYAQQLKKQQKKHDEEIQNIRQEYKAKEQEFLDMIDNS